MSSYKSQTDPVISIGRVQVKTRTLLVTILIVLIAVIGALVYYSQSEGYKAYISYLQKENENLKAENTLLKDRNRDVDNDLGKYRTEFSSLQSSFSNLASSTKKLHTNIEQFNDDNLIWEDHLPEVQAALREVEAHTGELETRINQFSTKLSENRNINTGSPSTQSTSASSAKERPGSDSREDEQNITVYVTNTGSKYHRAGCSYLRSSNPLSLKEAIAKGYTACSRCW
jgi:hypothetical protein